MGIIGDAYCQLPCSIQRFLCWARLMGGLALLNIIFLMHFSTSVFWSVIMMNHILRDIWQSTMPTIDYLIRHWSLFSAMQSLFDTEVTDSAKLPTAASKEFTAARLSKEFMDDLQYALQHAVSIYPTATLEFLNIATWTVAPSQSTAEFIADLFGLVGDDWMISCDPLIHQICTFLNWFFYFRGRNDVYEPVYYLVRDDRRRRYVLCIRGSSTFTDAMTDATANSCDFKVQDVKGKAHDGILDSARHVYYSVIHKLREIFKDEGTLEHYDLIVTGHSLGAGVASMVGLLFIQDKKEEALNRNILKKLKVFSFATPSIVSDNIATEHGVPFITSVILNTDIVSRIGVQSLESCRDQLNGIETEKCRQITDANCGRKDGLHSSSVLEGDRGDVLCPAGRVLWALPKEIKDERRSLLTVMLSALCMSKGGKVDSEKINAKDKQMYGQDNWTICDVTKQRDTFQKILHDGYESAYAHLPHRYAWAMGLDRHLNVITDPNAPY